VTGYALDYVGRPGGAAMAVTGYAGAVRYIGFDPADRSKCIGPAEYRDLTGHGRAVAVVYENQTGDALGGRAAGRVAATRARDWADRIGHPRSRPIYMACDTDLVTDPDFTRALDYLRGAGDVLGGRSRVGVYGEYDLIERAHAAGVADWYWQATAWSHHKVSTHAHLLQLLGAVYVGGVQCDRNQIRADDWGQWPASNTKESDVPLTPADIDAVWNEPMPWPDGVDLPHGKKTYTMREWVQGANLGAARALEAAGDIHRTVAALTAQMAALTALVQQPGGVDAAQLHTIALDAAKEALDGVTVRIDRTDND
jgi:hypothetical protein